MPKMVPPRTSEVASMISRRPRGQLDPADAQGGGLAPAQPGVRQDIDQSAVRAGGRGEGSDLVVAQEPLLACNTVESKPKLRAHDRVK
jgi:hypothetical protein